MSLTIKQLKGTDGSINLKLDSTNKFIVIDDTGNTIKFKSEIKNNNYVLTDGAVSYFINSKYSTAKDEKPISNQTIKNYFYHIKLFIEWLEKPDAKGNLITEINKDNLENLFNKYSTYLKNKIDEDGNAANVKSNTHNTYFISLYEFFKTNEIMEAIGLTKPVKPIIIKNTKTNPNIKRKRSFSLNTYKKILDTIPESNKKLNAIIKTLALTGLRVSELSNLKKQDIGKDIKLNEDGNPIIKESIKLDKHGLFIKPDDLDFDDVIYVYVKDGKGSKDRAVEVEPEILDILNAMIYDRLVKAYVKKPKPDEDPEIKKYYYKYLPSKVRKELNDDYVFKNQNLKQLRPESIQKLTRDLGKATIKRLESINDNDIDYPVLNKLHPHLFRKFNANMLLNEAGLSLELVRDRLGHEDIATTEIYIKSDKETKKKQYLKAMDKISL